MFVVCGVVGSMGDDGVHECGLSVYGSFYVSGGPMHGEVKVVHSVVLFGFCCEL